MILILKVPVSETAKVFKETSMFYRKKEQSLIMAINNRKSQTPVHPKFYPRR